MRRATHTTAEDWVGRIFGAPFGPIINVVIYPLLILLLVGIWIGRQKLLDDPDQHRARLRRLFVGGVGVSLLGALPLALARVSAFEIGETGYRLLGALQILTGVCGGVGYAAGFGLLGMRLDRRRGPVTRSLAAAGQRSLSVYLFVSVGVATSSTRQGLTLRYPGSTAISIAVVRAG